MLRRLGRFTVRRRRWVLAGTLVAVVVAGALSGGVFGRLSSGGFTDPAAPSTRGAEQLEEVFGAGDPNLVLLVTATEGSVDERAVAAEGVAITEELAKEPSIEQAFSYWTLGAAPPLRSGDGSQALVRARIGGDEDAVDAAVEELFPRYTRDGDLVTVGVGGQAESFRQVSTQVESDLQRAETITFPIVLILLILVFGSVAAAGLPLAVAGISVVGTLLVLFLLTLATDVSIFSINLTTALGIGLGIGYSRFIVSRFREEMRAGRSSNDAVVRTVETAGRTILFSAITVAISLAALLVFPMYFLRSFAYAGIAVVALAGIGALVFLPSLLAAIVPRSEVRFARRPGPARERVEPAGPGSDPGELLVPGGCRDLGGGRGRRSGRTGPRCRGRPVRGRAVRSRGRGPGGRVHRLLPGRTDGLPPDGGICPVLGSGRHLAGRGPVGGADLRGGGAAGPRQPVDLGSLRDARDGALSGAGRLEGERVRPAPAGGGDHRRGDLRAPVPHDRQRPGPDQGDRPEPAEPDGDVRRDGLDLPGREPVRPAGLHRHRNPGHVDADPHVLHRLRPVHGLRGVPAVA